MRHPARVAPNFVHIRGVEIIATSAMRMHIYEARYDDHIRCIDDHILVARYIFLPINSLDACAIDTYGTSGDVCCSIYEVSIT